MGSAAFVFMGVGFFRAAGAAGAVEQDAGESLVAEES
jgi:hypothetical protein